MRLVEIKNKVDIETGATSPVVVSMENKTAVSFYRQVYSEEDVPVQRNIVYDKGVYSVLFYPSVFHKFGFPDNESIFGHRYSSLGLESFSFYKLEDSDLIQELMRVAQAHPYFDRKRWDTYNHYILTFHDEMFECIAPGFEVRWVDEESVYSQSSSLLREFCVKQL